MKRSTTKTETTRTTWAAFALAVTVVSAASAGTYLWYEDANGFSRAVEEATEEGKPLAVYFYTDWCGYCRQLERGLLERSAVEDYLSEVAKVRINPENGPRERALANQYGVGGYPAFFFHPGPGNKAKKLSGRVRRKGTWQLQSPEEFVKTLDRLVERAN